MPLTDLYASASPCVVGLMSRMVQARDPLLFSQSFFRGNLRQRPPDGNEFGESSLISSLNRLATLPVNELFPAIVNEVCRFSPQEHFDDVCMVAVERK